MNGLSNSVYSKRKRFLPAYRELFSALLNIPDEDEDVRNRVMDAVNGIQKCSVCKVKSAYMMDVGTQTEDTGNTSKVEIIECSDTIDPKPATFEKRRRKRKRNCPKVVKTAQHSGTTPVLKQDNIPKVDTQPRPAKIMRRDSEEKAIDAFFDDCSGDGKMLSIDLDTPLQNAKTVEHIKQQMKIEWETCETPNEAGLLPIHQAIIMNKLPKLKRQIYVWKFRKANLMSILTDEGDNLLQLAIKENCLKFIIDELLKEDINLNDIDDDCNTIIHLAVSCLTYDDAHQQQQLLKSFESLLRKIDLKILLQHNNDGLTALHMAVKANKYLMVEKILNVIDDRLNLRSVCRLTEPCADVDRFLQHYCKQCDSFDGREQNELKNKILNAADMKRGCTVLYFAMELRHEHIVYLLMAHMCNPNVKNLSGVDAKTYYTEYGGNPSIVGALEKLTMVLQK